MREDAARSGDDRHARRPRGACGVLPLGFAEDDQRAGSDHGELLRCDLLARRPEDVGVLEGDVGEDDDGRAQDVGRVVPSSEPRLDNRDLDARRGELGEGGRRQRLELRRLDRLRLPAHAIERGLEIGIPTADADPLGPGEHVRRGVGAREDSLGQEQRLGRASRRRLPVRADDVDRPEAAMRAPQSSQQVVDPSEAELLGPRTQRLEPGEVIHRGHRARGGSARASRARPRRRRAARSPRSSRSRACPRSARPPCAGGRSRPRGFRSSEAAPA